MFLFMEQADTAQFVMNLEREFYYDECTVEASAMERQLYLDYLGYRYLFKVFIYLVCLCDKHFLPRDIAQCILRFVFVPDEKILLY